MHFSRTEEQDELAGVVRSLLDRRSDSAAVRAAMQSDTGYDEALWQALCEQVGVAALAIPESYGGFGASLVETSVVLEELGRAASVTARGITLPSSPGTTSITGTSAACRARAERSGSRSVPMRTTARSRSAWARTRSSNRAPFASPPATHTTVPAGWAPREAAAVSAGMV